jgi:SAM-dependent methyltransferase
MPTLYFGRDLEAMSFAANYHRWIVDEFKFYLGDHVVEVGAGTGNFTHLLHQIGQVKRLDVFEPSMNMYAILAERFRKTVEVDTFNCFFEEKYQDYNKTLDSVVYVNVLEHIADDARELSLVHSALKPNGYLLIFVPALAFLFSDLDSRLGHFRRYHKNGLSDLVRQAGFDILIAKYFDSLGVIPWYIAFVLLKKNLSGGNVTLYDKAIVPILRKIESKWVPPIGKNLLLIAKKA